MLWHMGLRAMKTVEAGAVGANGGEATLTHCGRSPGIHWKGTYRMVDFVFKHGHFQSVSRWFPGQS